MLRTLAIWQLPRIYSIDTPERFRKLDTSDQVCNTLRTQNRMLFVQFYVEGQSLAEPSTGTGWGDESGIMSLLQRTWGPVASNASNDIVPKAGHRLGMSSPSPSKIPAN